MTISLIVAMSENRAIANAGHLPWHLPADLQHFKKLTMGSAIIMGSKTFISIGRSLPGRLNIVMSRQASFSAPGCLVVNSPESAIIAAGQHNIMVIGGADIYRLFLPLSQIIYLTLIKAKVTGDTFMPDFGPHWRQVSRENHQPDPVNPLFYSFIKLVKNNI